MNKASEPRPWLFLDDGHPESRDYDDNYVGLERKPPRGLLDVLRRNARREPVQPQTLRIVPASDTAPA